MKKKRIIVLCISEESAKYAEGTFVKGSYVQNYREKQREKEKMKKGLKKRRVMFLIIMHKSP